jgi:hypothetical protein
VPALVADERCFEILYFPQTELMSLEKGNRMKTTKKVNESAKPLSQHVLRKMIASGKSVTSKAYDK